MKWNEMIWICRLLSIRWRSCVGWLVVACPHLAAVVTGVLLYSMRCSQHNLKHQIGYAQVTMLSWYFVLGGLCWEPSMDKWRDWRLVSMLNIDGRESYVGMEETLRSKHIDAIILDVDSQYIQEIYNEVGWQSQIL